MDGVLKEALSISGIAIVMVFVILTLLMLALQLSAVIFGRKSQPTAPTKPVTAVRQRAPVTSGGTADNMHVPVIVAALEAAGILTSGGRVHIEKVSRRSE